MLAHLPREHCPLALWQRACRAQGGSPHERPSRPKRTGAIDSRLRFRSTPRIRGTDAGAGWPRGRASRRDQALSPTSAAATEGEWQLPDFVVQTPQTPVLAIGRWWLRFVFGACARAVLLRDFFFTMWPRVPSSLS